MRLKPDDFRAFHKAVHGYEPFAWQQRLLDQIVEKRRWPEVLDLPTGAGKTTCLDIGLFALALDAENEELWCPRRIAMVVDRRVVVDQVAERGRKLEAALRCEDAKPVVREVARRLTSLSREGDEPLGVFTLRGGMPKDDGWARSPDQPLILASTVDQLGSRLLMQGYGVSANMAPVHAGLVGNDTLLLLDEVHLSEPFAETLDQLQTLRRRFENELFARFHCAFLSATPVGGRSKPFQLLNAEVTGDEVLRKRLEASKKVRLREGADRQGVERTCVEEARRLIEAHGTVAAVLNRVSSAVVVASELQKAVGDRADIVLLTGRMRPLDRDDVLRGLRPRIESGRIRSDETRRIIVVATQCIEAGADFDFDALVTEAASLAALRQRFGRVDRLGDYGRAEGVIVRDKEAKDDPIYGESLLATWKWLAKHLVRGRKKKGEEPTIDFGVQALPVPEMDERDGLLAPSKHAPTLLPAYLDLWSQTSPVPALVPDVALFLHGPESGPADVQIVWRADVTEKLLHDAAKGLPARTEELLTIVSAIRPSSLEALSLPFGAAKRWLGQVHDIGDVVDVEGAPEAERETGRTDGLALRWRGDESEVLTSTNDLRPGDTLVVPAQRGGLRDGCFEAQARLPVSDLAERAALFGRGRAMLRLDDEVLSGLGLASIADHVEADDRDEVDGSLTAIADGFPEGSWKKLWLQNLVGARRVPLGLNNENQGLLLGKSLPKKQLHELFRDPRESTETGVALTTDEEDSVFAGCAVPLTEHSADVARFAREFAASLRLPANMRESLAIAGFLHDLGKADRRFQVWLRGGSEIEFYKDETPWAKSGIPQGARAAQRRARQLSGYPRGGRHEVQSVAMLTGEHNLTELQRQIEDKELVLHLIASHHGYCRPFAPVTEDPKPIEVSAQGLKGWTLAASTSGHGLHRLDSAIPERFWKLQDKYGWLELCWLEAALRLADHRASEEEQLGGR